jgi:serine/threonine protein kinase, bacterial
VPAPHNSAQHRSAVQHRNTDQHQPPKHHPTRQLTRGTPDWPAEADDENHEIPGQFAGIDLIEFALERQHARRMVLIWIAIVLSVTGMAIGAAWTIGSNLSGLVTGQGPANTTGGSQSRSISATRKASSSDCWVFSLGSHAVS